MMNHLDEVYLIDATEIAIEHPKKQSECYSGKKQHTMKIQVVFNKVKNKIDSIFIDKGSVHDYKMYQQSKLPIHNQAKIIAESGYQGIQKTKHAKI